MKAFSLGLAPVFLALASCDMNASFNSTGSFDPLAPPGSGSQLGPASYGPDLSPGSFVSANIPNTAFYKNKPKGEEDADKLLEQGTNMKIVSSDSNHVKVELDSGEVGWVPAVMVASASGAMDANHTPLPGDDLTPIPVIDPDGLPPGGAIPGIIDPDAPITIDPVPDLKPFEPDAKPDEVEEEEDEVVDVEEAAD